MRKTRTFAPPAALVVRRAAKYGRRSRAVFAAAPIRAGAVIETCPVIRVPAGELDPGQTCTLSDYVFVSRPDPAHGDVLLIALGFGSLYNHSDAPNARFVVRDDALVITAARAIAAGEEVTFDYGYPVAADPRPGVARLDQ
ncbi:MAG: SET domain-containing protein-lysine N-methyltransferase [Fimbriiglobus sp.]